MPDINTLELTVGQEVAVASPNSYSQYFHFGYVVKKVTGGGQVVISRVSDGYERRFDKRGYEMGTGSSIYYRCSLRTDVAELREHHAKGVRKNAAVVKLKEVASVADNARHTWSKVDLLANIRDLEEKVAEARALVEAI